MSLRLFLGAPASLVFERFLSEFAEEMGISSDAVAAHPDVQIVRAPEEKTATGRQRVISVEDIRDVLERLSLTSLTGKKYLFIPDADALSDAAQNALLKAIEDPVGILVACFFAENEYALLPTLRSRLSTHAFAPLLAPAWEHEDDVHPERFLHARTTADRFTLIHLLLARYKENVSVLTDWLTMLLALAAPAGERAVFLAAVQAREGIERHGNVVAWFDELCLI